MKKLFMLLALVLGVVSCQNEPEGFGVVVGGEQDVNITVSLPDETRADSAQGFDLSTLSTSDYELRYILEIYLKGGEDSKKFREVKYSDATTVSFPVRLAPSREYHFAVWADLVKKVANRAEDADADYYYKTSDGLKNITIDVDTWTPNVEARDAFYGKATLTKEQSIANLPTIELTRPFAKVRVVATDINDIRKFGIEPTGATVEYTSELYTSFNAVEGKVFGTTTTKTHNFNYDEVDKYEGTNGEQLTVFADYILVPANGGTVQFTLDVNAANGLIKSNSFNTQIPVERNKVTSIVGSVLTEGGNVSITINGTLEEKETINYVDTAEDLQEIINNIEDGGSANIELGGDIDLNDLLGAGILSTRAAEPTYGLLIPAGKRVVLDLQGYTISQVKECTASYSMIENRGTLTIADSSEANTGKISFKDTGAGDPNFGWGVYTITNSSNLTVNGGTIENISTQNTPGHIVHMYCAIQQGSSNALTTINNGVISTPSYRSVRATNGEVVINGGKFEGQVWMQSDYNRTTLTINGGEFEPKGGDGSSIFITNTNANGTKLRINDGYFKTKIGCTYPEKNDIKGSIFGGTFTTAAKEGTAAALINDDFAWVEADGLWTLARKPNVVKIGEEGYTSIQKAVAAAQNGDTITFVENVEQVDGVLITDKKNLTIDLNGKTFTVSEGASTNNRNFKVNGSSVVTIKNGTLVANGELTRGAYGTVRTEDTAVANLENLKLYSYRGYGLNVKANTGTTINIKDSEIYAQYSGGVEAAGGNIELTNVKIDQTGVYSSGAWCSVAIGVNGGGKVTVNSGNYSASTISTDANAAQGTWVAYVMSSGGTLNIKGGTFNGVVAETASAANACGLICADTKAIVNIYGGTFSSNGAILDMRNNTGGTPNPSATLYAGTFSADPRVSGLYASNLITIDSKSDIKEENGKWVVFVRPVAKIGDVEYETLEAAVAAAKAGNTITLVEDVTLAEELEIPAGITLNGNGKQINGTIYAGGDLTFAGHTKVTSFSASYYNRVITIGEGACLEITGTGRVSLAYGNTFNITGSIEDAKSTDKEDIYPSLIIPGGISITGGNNATMNVTNAYVQIGSTTSKNSAANGEFTLNFTNSIAEFTKEFGFYDPTGGVNPTFVMNIEDSVFTTGTKLYVTANSEVKVDNSVVTLGTYFRNSGKFDLTNGSVLTGNTIQFGENGGNNGAITVDSSSFRINCGNSTGHAFDGKGTGSITATNSATVAVQYYKDMTIDVDATSTFTGTDIYGNRKIHYVSDEMKLEPTNPDALGGAVIVSNVWNKTTGKGVITFDRDLTTIGDKAFQRVTNATPSNWATSITLPASVKSIGDYAFAQCYSLTTITIPDGVTTIGQYAFQSCDAVTTVTIGSRVSTIGSGAFYNCYEIKEFNCKSATPPALADKWVFNGVEKTTTVYVPAASVDTYKNAAVWGDFTNIVGK